MSIKPTRSTTNSRYSPYHHRDHEDKSESKSDALNGHTEDDRNESTSSKSNQDTSTTSPDNSKTNGEVVAPAKTPSSPSVSPSSSQDPTTEYSSKTSTETTKETTKETRETKEAKDTKDARDARDAREAREAREARDAREAREARESREARDTSYSAYSASSSHLPPVSQSRSAYSTSSYLTPTPTLTPTGPPQPLGASKVIHFRNVGASITKEDLMGIASPFGHVEQVVLMRSKNQALVQMRDLDAAVNLMEFYTRNPCAIRGKRIYLGFSRHQGLAAATPVNRIVLVTMQTDHNQSLFPYYINTDVIKQIFSTHGYVEKIVIITKPDKDLQSLVQFSSPESAVQAMHYLNTQTIYLGTDSVIPITLDLQFSNLTELTVKQNCDKSRDYSGLFQPPVYPQAYPAMGMYPGQMDPMAQMHQMQPPANPGADYSAYYQM